MANATATATAFAYPSGIEYGQRTETLRGTIAVTSNVYNAGGIPVSFNLDGVKTLAVPFQVLVWSANPLVSNHTTYIYSYNTSTNNLQIWVVGAVSGAGLSELTPGTVPAGVVSDTIQFEALFNKFSFFTT